MSSAQNSECKRKRRKRNDQDGRNYVCKCGKSYLSYPALYTHIKTKHQDQQIKISKLSQTPAPGGYKNRAQNNAKNNSTTLTHHTTQTYHKQTTSNIYGNSYSNTSRIQTPTVFLHTTKINSLQSKKDLKQMKQYWISHRKQSEPFNQTYLTPLYLVFGRFINQLQLDVQNYCFKRYLYSFVFTVKRAVEEIKNDEKYFKHNTANQLPSLFNQIFKNYMINDSNQYLSNPTVATKTIYYLCRWLYVQKFTNYSLKYNF